MTDTTTQIDFIRHGEPLGGKRYRGQIDDPLSETGWQQMWRAVGDAAPWQQIVTSPLARCQAFAAALAEHHGLPVTSDARLMEIGFGIWEGRTAEQLRAEDPQQIERFYQDPINARPQGAEPLAEFSSRVITGFNDLAGAYQGQQVLVVCHAGVMRAVVAHVLGAPLESIYRIDVAYAAITRVRFSRERPPTLVSHAGCRIND
jgi:alpha-ribazole phosphatase/probable phosphoglycerate mutase